MWIMWNRNRQQAIYHWDHPQVSTIVTIINKRDEINTCSRQSSLSWHAFTTMIQHLLCVKCMKSILTLGKSHSEGEWMPILVQMVGWSPPNTGNGPPLLHATNLSNNLHPFNSNFLTTHSQIRGHLIANRAKKSELYDCKLWTYWVFIRQIGGQT